MRLKHLTPSKQLLKSNIRFLVILNILPAKNMKYFHELQQ